MTEGIILEVFAGPGGLSEGARMAGLPGLVGIDWDAAACATRRAAGHKTIRADVAAFPVEQLASLILAIVGSPPCTTFSAAGTQAGNTLAGQLAALIRDLFGGRDTRPERRREMGRVLHAATPITPTRKHRARKIAAQVRSAALVAEPARYIRACHPEWIVLEQVPSVLVLWQVYAGELRKLGYSVWCGVLNAADYGVPQTRQRAILIASRVRTVRRPEPTHYDPRKGAQLWGTPWVSMAEALGWDATSRPIPTVTAGGARTGGAEPLARAGREALEAERDAGAWALRIDAQTNATVRSASAPAPALKFGHSSAEMQWVLRRDRGAGLIERGGQRRDHPVDEPAPTLTAGTKGSGPRMAWVTTGQQTEDGNGDLSACERPTDTAAPTVTTKANRWTLHTNRGQDPDGTRQTVDPQSAPAPALTAKSGGQWVVTSFRNNNNNACERSLDEPAGTLFFGHRSNWAAWTLERPATTVQGDPRVGRPGHKDRDKGESQFGQDSVRITPEEAAALQSFPPGYPFRGTKTAQFTQIGNAIPPLLAAHIVSMATGISLPESVAGGGLVA